MRHWFSSIGIPLILAASLLLATAGALPAGAAGPPPENELVEYVIVAVDPGSWVATVKEPAGGDLLKLRLPPVAFKGHTFDAAVDNLKPGQVFSAQGPAGARLGQVVLQEPGDPPGRGARPPKTYSDTGIAPPPLAWEILAVNKQSWEVNAKHRASGKVMKFKVNPQSFVGFRIRARLHGVAAGQGLTLVAPNTGPIANCCTLVDPAN